MYRTALAVSLFCLSNLLQTGLADEAVLSRQYYYDFPLPSISYSGDGAAVAVAGCYTYAEPGHPLLPVQAVTLESPSGYTVGTVRFFAVSTEEFSLSAPLVCGRRIVALSSSPDSTPALIRDTAIYAGSAPFPDFEAGQQHWRTDRRNGREEITLTFYPVQVIPARDLLLAHSRLCVEIEWRREDPTDPVAGRVRGYEGTVVAGLAGRDKIPYETSETTLPQGHFAHVIIAPDELSDTPPPWNLTALTQARAAGDLASTIVTTAWIYENFEGRDNAEKIRNFLRDASDFWGTRYALLVGTVNLIPARNLHCIVNNSNGNIPSDSLYYGCLDGDFDYNGNNVFGEYDDGEGGGDIDLVAEIHVGRFPVSNADELAHMVRKTLFYESLPAEELSKIAMIGEYLGFGGAAEYATGALEEIRLSAGSSGMDTLGFLNPHYAGVFDTDSNLYDTPDHRWSRLDMLDLLNRKFHVFNHLGHGSHTKCFKINVDPGAASNYFRNLTNDVPYLAYSQACNSGRFDDKPTCFARQFVTASNSACAAVMNTREGWGFKGAIGGPSHFFNRMFWDVIIRGEAHTLGGANSLAREKLRHLAGPTRNNHYRWCYFEITLFGDPGMPFGTRIMKTGPDFGHEPLENSFNTQDSHPITALMEPTGMLDTTSPYLVWRSTSDPGILHTNYLQRTLPGLYESAIPAQPMGTTLHYYLGARTLAGVEGVWPEQGEHSFSITPPISLHITATPQEWGDVAPGYGSYTLASGVVIRASAPARVIENAGLSRALTGCTVNGILRDPDELAAEGFTLEETTVVNWLWQNEYSLQYKSDIPSFLQQSLWLPASTVVDTELAPETRQYASRIYRFAGWYIDGVRQPEAPALAHNPAVDIAMDSPRLAYALYLHEVQDADGNGVPDWWEYRYFGMAGLDPELDHDNDGFGLLEEFEDRTDPLNPESFPRAPLIIHTPLESVLTTPPPWEICAVITDSHEVSLALFEWRCNGGIWHTNELVQAQNDPDLYWGDIIADGSPGDRFEYQLRSRDPAGHEAICGPYTIDLHYPRTDRLPYDALQAVATNATEMQISLPLANSGNEPLIWRLVPGWHEPVAPDSSGWETNAFGQTWSISTQRYHSPPFSFHGRARSGGTAASPPVYAGLLSPRIDVPEDAGVSFKYWIAGEPDKKRPGWAFDGGIVEVSTDDGETFTQLEGRYTHRMAGWKNSPWPDRTPCFSGDGSEGWREAWLSLAPYAGEEIRLRFMYGGDNNSDGEGWYLDDIRIAPVKDADWPAWLSLDASTGVIQEHDSDVIRAFFNTANMTGRDASLPVHLLSNDPVNPDILTGASCLIRSLPTIRNLTAAQTSTDGEGLVTVMAQIMEEDGEPLDLDIYASFDDGESWIPVPLTGAQAVPGMCSLPEERTNLVHIAGGNDSGSVTNLLTLNWSTRRPDGTFDPVQAEATLIRLRAANPYFMSESAYSNPFLIDNKPPSAGEAFVDLQTSQFGPYTVGSHIRALWGHFSDDGSGIAGYRLTLQAVNEPDSILSTVCSTQDIAAVAGVTNTVIVRAIDHAGNISPGVSAQILVLAPDSDSDGDGHTAAQEELAGTDATDPASVLLLGIESPAKDSDAIVALVWNSLQGRRYTVEVTESLKNPDWKPLEGLTSLQGSGGTVTNFVSDDAPLFMRLKVVPEEPQKY